MTTQEKGCFSVSPSDDVESLFVKCWFREVSAHHINTVNVAIFAYLFQFEFATEITLLYIRSGATEAELCMRWDSAKAQNTHT